ATRCPMPMAGCHKSRGKYIVTGKKYVEDGCTHAVLLDLSKYFDTLNHQRLLNLLRQDIPDKRVIQLIKKYLKAGVMEDGVVCATEEGTPQGGPLSPLLANIYLHEFDMEMEAREVRYLRYADDIVLFAKSKRASERLLTNSIKFLEQRLKLTVNREKSKAVSVYSRQLKFLGFRFGKNRDGVLILAHWKSLQKAKKKLRMLTKRNRGRNVRSVMAEMKQFLSGWLGYFYIASIKSTLTAWNKWLRRRIRMYIWKQWKKPKTKVANLQKLGIPAWQAYQWGNSRKGYWAIADSPILTRSITDEKLARAGYFNFPARYEQLRQCI
ncbi:MAG: group II intron reverse transcriptase/maturase, partial [Oscillospiraceae bacterium]|nr:group II intron reverse transcriptase/maturase [Oscillospiraceae bacterium]